MAKASFKATLGGNSAASATGLPDIPGTIDYTTVAANIATLVADGVTPTQAHVTTLNGNWTLLAALIDTAKAQSTTATTVTIDLATITDIGKLNETFRAIKQAALEGGLLR